MIRVVAVALIVMAGFDYAAFGGQYLTGYQVESNSRFDGSGGAYWRIKTLPEYGNLSIGANFFGMHYAHNEQAFTFNFKRLKPYGFS